MLWPEKEEKVGLVSIFHRVESGGGKEDNGRSETWESGKV